MGLMSQESKKTGSWLYFFALKCKFSKVNGKTVEYGFCKDFVCSSGFGFKTARG